MNCIRIGIVAFLTAAQVAQAEPPEWSAAPDVAITIKTTEGTMRYNLSEFSVEPGAKVKLTLENEDQLQHNLVLLRAEGNAASGLQFAQGVWAEGEAALARGWMPSDNALVLVATRLMDPKAIQDLYFEAPAKAGDYPFVCTVPGHATIMNGVMKVRQVKSAFKDLRYTLYEGEFTQLPDFASLKPVESGPVPSGLISLDVIGKRKPENFALIFDATLETKDSDVYEFFLGSDDGSRLIVDGEGELEVNGIHPFKTVSKKLKLEKGTHTVQLQYFEASGGEELALMARGKKTGLLTMSKDAPPSMASKTPPPPVIRLRPVNEGEAVVYRNFIQGSSPRGIAVGYPGAVNICWDADVCNVALLWRGAFMDAGKHWTGRGVGDQPPMGFDVAAPAKGYPLQVLSNPSETWKAFSLGTVKFEKDVPETQREITIKVPNPDYRFRGYRLDSKRFPTFTYDFRKLAVTDRFDPSGAENTEALVRTVSIKGESEKDAVMRIAVVAGLPDSDGWHVVGPVSIRIEGTGNLLRPAEGGQELLVPVSGPLEFKVHYRWLTAIAPEAAASK